MPIYKDTYGYGNFTIKKFSDFDDFIKSYLAIAKSVINKYKEKCWFDPEFHYIDMNAGPGILPDLYNNQGDLVVKAGTFGSPFAFTRWAEKYWGEENELKYRVDFIEQNPELCAMLYRNMKNNPLSKGGGQWHVGDHDTHLPQILEKKIKWKFGLIYHDPNNGQVNFDAIRYCVQMRPKYEILINLPGALFKRSPEHYQQEVLLSDHINGLKDVWMIKDLAPGDKHQWTFLLGTDFTQMKDFENIGMYSLGRPKGAKIFERVNLSKRQQQRRYQPALPIEMPAYSTYEEYLAHPKFRAIRKQAMESVNYICQQCQQARATQVHHLRYPPWGEFDEPENLMPICCPCHCKIHGKEE